MNDNINLIGEYGYIDTSYDPLDRFFESIDNSPEWLALDEVSYQQRAENAVLQLEIMDIPLYIKQN